MINHHHQASSSPLCFQIMSQLLNAVSDDISQVTLTNWKALGGRIKPTPGAAWCDAGGRKRVSCHSPTVAMDGSEHPQWGRLGGARIWGRERSLTKKVTELWDQGGTSSLEQGQQTRCTVWLPALKPCDPPV